MPVFQLDEQLVFPPIDYAENDGLLAIGGDLNPDRLLIAYESGIFPWYSEESPILWWSPNPRFVINTNAVHVSKSMHRLIRNETFTFKVNTAFDYVIDHCSKVPRKGQDGTWITSEMIDAYRQLHKSGKVFSFEAWKENVLVGGMYGVYCKHYFAGESMFSLENNASKFALIKACEFLSEKGIELLDCQIYTDHLESLGAYNLERDNFKEYLSIRSESQ